jgi:hypothetical protein
VHPPGRVFTDLAVAVADGADAISGIAVLGDREELFGAVALNRPGFDGGSQSWEG